MWVYVNVDSLVFTHKAELDQTKKISKSRKMSQEQVYVSPKINL